MSSSAAFGVIFDLDGVLIDSPRYNRVAINEVLASYGLSLDQIQDARGEGNTGRSLRDLVLIIKEKYGVDVPLREIEERVTRRGFELLREAPDVAYPHLKHFLSNLQSRGVLLAVGSSSTGSRVRNLLSWLGILDYFTTIVSADDVRNHKPSPDTFLEAARRLGLPPSRCVVVEDSALGVESATRAGMKVIGFLAFQYRPNPLTDSDLVVHDLTERSYDILVKLFSDA